MRSQKNGCRRSAGFKQMTPALKCGANYAVKIPRWRIKNSAFYISTKNFNHPAFDKHANSREHQKVVQVVVNMHSQPSGLINRWQEKRTEEQHQALLAFHKAKHACPICSYEEDIPLLKRLRVNVGTVYHSQEGSGHIMQCITQTITSDLSEKLK